MRTAVISETASRGRSAAADERSLRHAVTCAKVADDFRGENTVVLDLRKVTPIVDYFVITTAASRRQMHAIAEEADRQLAEAGSQRMGIEGYRENVWILQDYGDVVLHVFNAEARSLYDLEALWADAERIDWAAVLERQGATS